MTPGLGKQAYLGVVTDHTHSGGMYDGEFVLTLSYREDDEELTALIEEMGFEHRLDTHNVHISTTYLLEFSVVEDAAYSLDVHNIAGFMDQRSAWATDQAARFRELEAQGWRVRTDEEPSFDGPNVWLDCDLMPYGRLANIRCALDRVHDKTLPDACVDLIGAYCGYPFVEVLGARPSVPHGRKRAKLGS